MTTLITAAKETNKPSTKKNYVFGVTSKEFNTMDVGRNINQLLNTNVRPSEGFESASVDQRKRIDRPAHGRNEISSPLWRVVW